MIKDSNKYRLNKIINEFLYSNYVGSSYKYHTKDRKMYFNFIRRDSWKQYYTTNRDIENLNITDRLIMNIWLIDYVKLQYILLRKEAEEIKSKEKELLIQEII